MPCPRAVQPRSPAARRAARTTMDGNREREDHADRMKDDPTATLETSPTGAEAVELEALRRTVRALEERLARTETRLTAALAYEQELRDQLTSTHQQLVYRDAEVMATLGLALIRHAPGAPAAIYYRQLLDRVRASVVKNLPPEVPVAVASLGDEAMLELDGRRAWHFPGAVADSALAYTIDDTVRLLEQLEALRQAGAQYLLLPASAWSWSARYPKLNRWIETLYHPIVRDDGVCNIYDLRRKKPTGLGTV